MKTTTETTTLMTAPREDVFGFHGTIKLNENLGAARDRRLAAICALNRRLDHAAIECRDWSAILDTYDSPGAFFFLDPPYFDDGGACYKGWSLDTLTGFCTRLQTLVLRYFEWPKNSPQRRTVHRLHRFTQIGLNRGDTEFRAKRQSVTRGHEREFERFLAILNG